METKDIRKEINKVIEKMPDDILENILDYLKEVEQQVFDKVKLAQNFKKILKEDKELLQKLAQ